MSPFASSTRVRHALAIALVGAIVSSCSDDPSAPEDPTPPGPTVLTIGLDASNALPGERITVSGLPDGFDVSTVQARVIDSATGGETPALVGRDPEDDSVYLLAPLNPADPSGGGNAEIELIGDDITSNRVGLAIDPLPAATTSIQDVVTLLQDAATSWFAYHGTSRAELRAMDPATLSVRLLPLFVAQELLDDPDNPNSLRKMVDGPIPLFEDEAVDFDVVNRLLSTVDSDGFFGAETAGVDSASAERPQRLGCDHIDRVHQRDVPSRALRRVLALPVIR